MFRLAVFESIEALYQLVSYNKLTDPELLLLYPESFSSRTGSIASRSECAIAYIASADRRLSLQRWSSSLKA